MLPLCEKGVLTIVYLFGNAGIGASTVLACSCCRIHRYVAAPLIWGIVMWVHLPLLYVGKDMLEKSFILKSLFYSWARAEGGARQNCTSFDTA